MLLLPCCLQAQRLYSKLEQDIAVVSYTVQAGISFQGIAEKFHVSSGDLVKLNHQESNANLLAGTTINIPVSTVLKPSCDNDCLEVY